MTDIVARLHEAVAHIVCEDGCDLDKVMAEAADEIERLRAALTRLTTDITSSAAAMLGEKP